MEPRFQDHDISLATLYQFVIQDYPDGLQQIWTKNSNNKDKII